MVQILAIIYFILIFKPNFGQIFPLGSAPLYPPNNQLQWPQTSGGGTNSPTYFSVLTPLNQQQQQLPQQQTSSAFFPQQLIVPYSSNNLLWPFSSQQPGGINYLSNNRPNPSSQFQQQQSQQQPFPYYYYYPQQQQPPFLPQQNQDNSSPLNELIAQLSLALVRSFAQILSSQKDSTNNNESNSGGGGIIRTTREGIGGFFGIPFGQPIQQQQQPFQAPSFTGKISNNYGYGVNAGVFAGTYGGSENVASPYGPYGALNSQTGSGSYSGLSPWPLIPGQFRRPSSLPLQPSGGNSSSSLLTKEKQPTISATGQGTIRQIPLTENVQTEAGGGQQQQQQNVSEGQQQIPEI